MTRPIMLWMTSRSRSSLVAKIFIEHGVWWGDTVATQPTGDGGRYVSYENTDIKALLGRYKARHWGTIHMSPVWWVEGFDHDLARIVPGDRQWVMKTGCEYFNAFQRQYPHNIYIVRKPEDVAASLVAKVPGTVYEKALEAVLWRYNYMSECFATFGGKCVSSDSIVAGDFGGIQAAVEYCGLEWDEGAIERAMAA